MDCAPKTLRRWNKGKKVVRKRPSANNVPCAETRDELDKPSTEIADETDETMQELLDLEFKMRDLFAAGDWSTAQTAEYEALQTRQNILTDAIWWQSIFNRPDPRH